MTGFSTAMIVMMFLFSVKVQGKSEVKSGMLSVRASESREVWPLDGLWNFRADDSPGRSTGFDGQWWSQPLAKTGAVIDMPVPSSFNDITQDRMLRDFVGWVWYDKEFHAPKTWINSKQRIVLRFEGAHYNAIVWVNSQEVTRHSGGHLPFEAEVTPYIQFETPNRVTVAVNNTLTPHTLPPGVITYFNDTKMYPPNYFEQSYQFDFFNYAGLQRPVKLYTTPKAYIDDISINTTVIGLKGLVQYNVTVGGVNSSKVTALVDLLEEDGAQVGFSKELVAALNVPNAKLWWPYTMRNESAYLYTLKVTVFYEGEADIYRIPFGIRTVRVTNKQFFINDQQFYFHGVNKHEDADIRGKGVDYPLIIKDINLLKWLGVNGFRTSHYPYSEEIMDLCDRHGIVVIDESPAVGMHLKDNFVNETLEHHRQVMAELVRRDKNRPSVVMWSVANEPFTTLAPSGPYFENVIAFTRELDPHRPVTFVANDHTPDKDHAAKFVDVLCLNSYFSWYNHYGHLEVVYLQVNEYLTSWHSYYNKPVIQTEYGAGTISGFHQSPAVMFTEEYQVDMMAGYQAVFDKLRQDFLIGELVWNFADFNTQQSPTRVVGNKKGLLTRQRQPKGEAHRLRDRYLQLIKSLGC
ncbi:beta-glucuronidase-like [Diadema antillarum]|uniref:beta-glucuronidase-like n=1 Tax=Diadema antillarum TaxID=105358 RepID=UPI003A86764D